MLISSQEKRNIYIDINNLYNAIYEIKKRVYSLEEAKNYIMTRIKKSEDRFDDIKRIEIEIEKKIEKGIDVFYKKYDACLRMLAAGFLKLRTRIIHSENRLDEIENRINRLERGMK